MTEMLAQRTSKIASKRNGANRCRIILAFSKQAAGEGYPSQPNGLIPKIGEEEGEDDELAQIHARSIESTAVGNARGCVAVDNGLRHCHRRAFLKPRNTGEYNSDHRVPLPLLPPFFGGGPRKRSEATTTTRAAEFRELTGSVTPTPIRSYSPSRKRRFCVDDHSESNTLKERISPITTPTTAFSDRTPLLVSSSFAPGSCRGRSAFASYSAPCNAVKRESVVVRASSRPGITLLPRLPLLLAERCSTPIRSGHGEFTAFDNDRNRRDEGLDLLFTSTDIPTIAVGVVKSTQSIVMPGNKNEGGGDSSETLVAKIVRTISDDEDARMSTPSNSSFSRMTASFSPLLVRRTYEDSHQSQRPLQAPSPLSPLQFPGS